MKRFKGTKGKWAVKHSESKTAFNIVGTKIGEKYKIARCPYLIIGERENINFNVREKEQANADAQLIATAPELLRVLIGMTLSMKAHPDYQLGKNQEFIDYVESAEQAINKALKL